MPSIEFKEPESVGFDFSNGTFFRKVKRAIKSIQCARYRDALNRMSNRQLEDIGLRRDDIPEFARKAADLE